jgi:hypothetical protein
MTLVILTEGDRSRAGAVLAVRVAAALMVTAGVTLPLAVGGARSSAWRSARSTGR